MDLEIRTPSGYIVILKRNYLTFGEKRQIESLFLKNIKIKNNQPDLENLLVIYEAQDLALEFLVKEIRMGDQVIKSNFAEVIKNWKEEDGKVVYDKINELTTIQAGEKK